MNECFSDACWHLDKPQAGTSQIAISSNLHTCLLKTLASDAALRDGYVGNPTVGGTTHPGTSHGRHNAFRTGLLLD
jgi:hypothetical protein